MMSVKDLLTSLVMSLLRTWRKFSQTLMLFLNKLAGQDQPWRLKLKKMIEHLTPLLAVVTKALPMEELQLNLLMPVIWWRIWSSRRLCPTALDATLSKRSKMFQLVQLSRTVKQVPRLEPKARTLAVVPKSILNHKPAKKRSLATKRRLVACLSDLMTFRMIHLVLMMDLPQNASDVMERKSTRKGFPAKSATAQVGSEISFSRISRRFWPRKSVNTAQMSIRNCSPDILSRRRWLKPKLSTQVSFAMAATKVQLLVSDTNALWEMTTTYVTSASQNSHFHIQCWRLETLRRPLSKLCANMTICLFLRLNLRQLHKQ